MSRKKTTAVVKVKKDSLALDSKKQFDNALKVEKSKRDMIQKFIKSELKENVDYGKIEIVSKKSGKKFVSKPTLFKSGSEKFASLLNLRPVFTEDPLTINQLPEQIKNQGVIILKCELRMKTTGETVSEGRGACTIQEVSGDINKCVKICQKRAQTDAVLRLGLSDSFTQDLDDQGDPDYKKTKEKTIEPPPSRDKLIEYFRKLYKRSAEIETPSQELATFCGQIDGLEDKQIIWGIKKLQQKLGIKNGNH